MPLPKPLLVHCALAAVKSTKKEPYFYYKYQALKKCRDHKKTIIAIARKMLVAIYHMIRDEADFLPLDHEKTITCRNHENKGPTLDNILTFLGKYGADEETLSLIKSQCSDAKTDDSPEKRRTQSPKVKSNPIQPPSALLSQNRMPEGSGARRPRLNSPRTSASIATA